MNAHTSMYIVILFIFASFSACTKRCISPLSTSNSYDQYILNADVNNMWHMQSKGSKAIYSTLLTGDTLDSKLILEFKKILQKQDCLNFNSLTGKDLFKLIYDKILSSGITEKENIEKYISITDDISNIFILNENGDLEKIGEYILEGNQWKVSKWESNPNILNMIRFFIFDFSLEKEEFKNTYFCK